MKESLGKPSTPDAEGQLGMLVLTLTEEGKGRDNAVNLYTQDGGFIGSVKLVEARGDRVRLGFTFPTEYAIVRESIDDGKGGMKPNG